jgi:hypothetical protein
LFGRRAFQYAANEVLTASGALRGEADIFA